MSFYRTFLFQMSSNKHYIDKSNNFRNTSGPYGTNNNNQTDIVVVNLKQTSHNNFRKNKYGTTFCDCQQQNHLQNCLKCSKSSDRNLAVNNNNFNNVNNNNMGGGSNPNMLSVSRMNSRGKLRQQSSSLGSFESSSNSPCLSRGNYRYFIYVRYGTICCFQFSLLFGTINQLKKALSIVLNDLELFLTCFYLYL